MKRGLLAVFLATFFAVLSADAQEKVDAAVMAKIRAEGMEHSHVMELFDHLVNVIGPRLTASPAYKTAVDWTRGRLVSMGFDNVHLEPWEFGRGWQLEHLTIEMVEPRYMPLIGYPKGWSPSTSGKLAAAPVWLGNTAEPVQKYSGKIAGSIVMTTPIQDDFVRNDRAPAGGDFRRQSLLTADAQQALRRRTQEVPAMLQNERAGITLEPSLGEE